MDSTGCDIFTRAFDEKNLLIINDFDICNLLFLGVERFPSTILIKKTFLDNHKAALDLQTIIKLMKDNFNERSIVFLYDDSYRVLPLRQGIKTNYSPDECLFVNDGFLPAYLLNNALNMPNPVSKLADLCITLNRMALSRISELSYNPDEEQKMFSALLFARSIRLFESSIILATLGMDGEGRSLLRGCIESSIIGFALSNNPELNVIKKLKGSNYAHYKKLNNTLNLNDGHKITVILKELLDSLRDDERYGQLKINELARESGLEHVYNAIFRYLSVDASHTTIDSLQKVAKRNIEKPMVVDAHISPDFSNLGETLLIAINCILIAFKGVQIIFPQREIDVILSLYNSDISTLTASMYPE